MKPRSSSTPISRTRSWSPTSMPASPRTTRPSTGGAIRRTYVPFCDAPVTIASNTWPSRLRISATAAYLRIRRSTFLAALSRSVQRLEQPLDDQVGVAAIWRGGMGVILYCKAEVAGMLGARLHHIILARPQQLHHREREIREMIGVGMLAPGHEIRERTRIRLGRQLAAEGCSQLDDPRPALGRAHHPLNRWPAAIFEECSHHAVGRNHEIFDHVARARLVAHGQIDHTAVVGHDIRLDRLKVERAIAHAQLPQPLGRLVLQ